MSPMCRSPALLAALVLAAALPAALAVPKKYDSSGPVSYYQQSGDQLAMESADQVPEGSNPSPATPAPNAGAGPAGRSEDTAVAASADGRPQEPRFGFVGYSANGVQDPTYGTAAGPYGALRLDLGGVLLGALIGLGASLVLPKLIHGLAAHPHDGYKRKIGPRSDDDVAGEVEGDGVMASLSHILSRVDSALAEQNIDSTACLQRAVCSYVQSSAARSASGEASGVESVVDTATKNSLVGYMLEGSSFKQAVDTGRKGGNCSKVYYKCPVNKDSLAAGIKSLISVAA
ncbi:uncharacterized protein LOC113211917 isoform X2 [Frankliniella occidentalis]|uniref:Uncharacterized protein LOC113211917 isoform X2 n=1 Tax=Frankliniella occidentalis TaxID=133901 RepID=A0A9C6WZX3_FRAOC|nr:uncharacterized protein LOC113211917 isoform X2 [Frankliniella occidentalis]